MRIACILSRALRVRASRRPPYQEFVEAQAVAKAAAAQKERQLAEAAARRAKRRAAASMIQRNFLRHKGASGIWLRILRQLEEEQSKLGTNDTDGEDESLLSGGREHSDGDARDGGSRGPGPSWDWGPPLPGSQRMELKELVLAPWFGHATTALVVVNLVLMCMPYYGMSDAYADRLEAAAALITWIFIGEMALKLTALGWYEYWSDGWNRLDGIIVSLSIVEIVLTALFAGAGMKLAFLRILRMLRVARMLRLMKSWKGLYTIVSTILKALPQLTNVMVLLVLITTIFALLGMQIFGGKFTADLGYAGYGAADELAAAGPDAHARRLKGGGGHQGGADGGELPRFHFDYFAPAMLTVFIVVTGATHPPSAFGAPCTTQIAASRV